MRKLSESAQPTIKNSSVARLRLPQVFLIVMVTFFSTLVLSGLANGVSRPSFDVVESSVCAPSLSQGAQQVDYLYLAIYVNHASGVDYYTPANFTVPSHAVVHVMVTNYDSGKAYVPSRYLNVCGTLNGTINVNGQVLSHLPATDAASTFTITNGTYSGFNAPIPPAPGQGQNPSVVTFAFDFYQAGTYHWQCESNDNGTGVSTVGQMAGLITVL